MIAFGVTMLAWLVSFILTIPGWLVSVVFLGWLAENESTVAGLALGVAGLMVGIGIYARQRQEAKKSEQRFNALIEARYEQLRSLIERSFLTQYPERKAEAKQFAATTAESIVNQVVLLGGAKLCDPKVVTNVDPIASEGKPPQAKPVKPIFVNPESEKPPVKPIFINPEEDKK